ncbi:hypothetical protein NDU88_002093 [Pleurodeles waltl]|uniref:Uncharacterized protein n=1 Tax=Pleurodeles waltl TaxID=8319 RepID=A0AAV7U8A7_PLEWA|nr:hypothetical protein NDU88_002093 [Pleurodeles waltl]
MEIVDPAGKRLYGQSDINASFTEYYSSLYASPMVTLDPEQLRCLEGIQLPALGEDDQQELGEVITPRDVTVAVGVMARGKVPGADGLPTEFYSAYIDLLVPQLSALYTEALQTGRLPHPQMSPL